MRALIGGLAAALVLVPPVWAEPGVWIVRDADSEMLLFGSVHILPPGLAWRPAALDVALLEAEDLWFELSVDAATSQEVARLASATGTLPPGQSLFTLLPPDDAARLLRIAVTYGVDRVSLDHLKPWLAEVALAAALYRRTGAASEHGVEATISAAAPPSARRKALETPAEQIALFNGASLPDQIASLRGSMDEIDADPDAFATLVAAWVAGDLATLERETQSLRKLSPALFQRLIVQRNAAWTTTLDARLKGKGRTVVVVGAGHLVGEDGLPARFRALGYSVTGP